MDYEFIGLERGGGGNRAVQKAPAKLPSAHVRSGGDGPVKNHVLTVTTLVHKPVYISPYHRYYAL